MGALANLRKRASDFLSLSFDSPYKINQIDTNPSKKRRISNVNQFSVEENSVSRLRKYPETVGRLRREVHAPCRSNRVGFLSRNGGIRVSDTRGMGNVIGVVTKLRRDYETKKRAAFDALRHVRVENKGLPEVVVIEDGDGDGNYESKKRAALRHVRVEKKGLSEVVVIEDGDGDGDGDYESKKRAAFDALRHVRVEKKGLSEVVVIEDGDGDEKEGVERDGLGLGVESRDLDRKGVENLVESDGDVVESEMLGREAYQELLSSVDRKYSSRLRSLDFEIKSNEAKLESVRSWRSARKQPDEKKPEEDVLRAAFVPLSEEEEDEVKSALLNANRRKILVTHENSNIQISGDTLQCLRPGAWLNDEVINVYLELLKEREKREPKKHLTCHFFSTFFYKKLIGGRNGYDYKAVKRWTSLRKLGYKLSECDKIFVPIHKEVHWCLAVINKKDKTFQYLDSLGGRDSQVLRVLAKYYMDEVKDKSGEDIDVTSWALEYVEDLPEQQNGFDCGVFMIKYADFYSRGTGLLFSQENMPYFRRRTAKEILKLQAH